MNIESRHISSHVSSFRVRFTFILLCNLIAPLVYLDIKKQLVYPPALLMLPVARPVCLCETCIFLGNSDKLGWSPYRLVVSFNEMPRRNPDYI